MKAFVGIFAFISFLVGIITFYILADSQGGSAGDPYFWSAIAFVVTYILLYVYCLPMLIAQARQHPQLMPIIILNIVGGWSGIAWLGALIWAVYQFDTDGAVAPSPGTSS